MRHHAICQDTSSLIFTLTGVEIIVLRGTQCIICTRKAALGGGRGLCLGTPQFGKIISGASCRTGLKEGAGEVINKN